MKIAHLLLAGSLLANAALVGWMLQPRRSPVPAAALAPRAPKVDPQAAANADALARLQTALVSGDTAALTAAGCSPEVARWLTAGRAFDRFQAKMRAAQVHPPAGKYWQRGALEGNQPSLEAKLEGRRAEREFSDALRDIYGEDLEAMFSNRESTYSFLSPEKLRKLQQIERDYGDMESQIYAEQDGITLPTDRDRLKLLEKEKERDIAAALTPEEREELELRRSNVADWIRNQYGDAIATEEQYRKIFAIRKAFDDARNAKMEALMGGPTPADLGKWMNEQEERIATEIRDIVGPDQWSRAQQANDQDARSLTALTQRLNLPPTAASAALSTRETYAAQSMAINADPTLSPADRRKQLQELAKQAQAALAPVLTADGAEAYAQRAQWISMLKGGQAFSTDPKDAPRGRPRLGTTVYPVPPPKQTTTSPGS